jgi:hypothetical protein
MRCTVFNQDVSRSPSNFLLSPTDASCSVQFWNETNCSGLEANVVPLTNEVQSECIGPFFPGVSHPGLLFGAGSPPAMSLKVTCS